MKEVSSRALLGLRQFNALRDNRKDAEHEAELQRTRKAKQEFARVFSRGRYSSIEWLVARYTTGARD